MGGMVLETNMNEIVAQIEAQNRLEKSEVSTQLSLALLVGEGLGGQWGGHMCWCVLLWNLRSSSHSPFFFLESIRAH